jgi:hypothetical protein
MARVRKLIVPIQINIAEQQVNVAGNATTGMKDPEPCARLAGTTITANCRFSAMLESRTAYSTSHRSVRVGTRACGRSSGSRSP